LGDAELDLKNILLQTKNDAELLIRRYEDKYGLESAGAPLTAKELVEYRKNFAEISRGVTGYTDELNVLSIKVQMSRGAAIAQQMAVLAARLSDGEFRVASRTINRVGQEATFFSRFAIETDLGLAVDWDTVSPNTLTALLIQQRGPDAFSERLWADREKLARSVSAEVSRGMVVGASAQDMADRLSGVMGSSVGAAMRIIRTETTAVATVAEIESYRQVGVREYLYLATLDSATSQVCRAMDGKIFNLDDYQLGANAPPLHPNCRSTIVPHIPDDGLEVPPMRAARDAGGDTVYVPADISYTEWAVDPDRPKPSPHKRAIISPRDITSEYTPDRLADMATTMSDTQVALSVWERTGARNTAMLSFDDYAYADMDESDDYIKLYKAITPNTELGLTLDEAYADTIYGPLRPVVSDQGVGLKFTTQYHKAQQAAGSDGKVLEVLVRDNPRRVAKTADIEGMDAYRGVDRGIVASVSGFDAIRSGDDWLVVNKSILCLRESQDPRIVSDIPDIQVRTPAQAMIDSEYSIAVSRGLGRGVRVYADKIPDDDTVAGVVAAVSAMRDYPTMLRELVFTSPKQQQPSTRVGFTNIGGRRIELYLHGVATIADAEYLTAYGANYIRSIDPYWVMAHELVHSNMYVFSPEALSKAKAEAGKIKARMYNEITKKNLLSEYGITDPHLEELFAESVPAYLNDAYKDFRNVFTDRIYDLWLELNTRR
jgi:SPP1 gp7 family putative phage head morphogenesis protein